MKKVFLFALLLAAVACTKDEAKPAATNCYRCSLALLPGMSVKVLDTCIAPGQILSFPGYTQAQVNAACKLSK